MDKQMMEWYANAMRRHAETLGWTEKHSKFGNYWKCTGCGKNNYATMPKKRCCPLKKKS